MLPNATTSLSEAISPQQVADSVENKCLQWKHYSHQGYKFHHQQKLSQALACFERCLQISKQLSMITRTTSTGKSGLEMYYFSSHNLASCYNATGKAIIAKSLLLELHTDLISTATDHLQERELRLEALANLDKSLFSLLAQLAYINEIEGIHSIILDTENIASSVAKELIK